MAQRPTKRVKTAHTTYASPADIRAALSAEDPSSALVGLRNQFAVWPSDHTGPIPSSDPRLLLAQQWLDASPTLQDVFSIWEQQANLRQPTTIVPIVSLLASLLVLLNSHYTFHASGLPLLRLLLTPQWMKKLNSYLGGTHNELLLVTLKLLNAMSAFGRGKERKTLLEAFAWETKSLPKLLNMRRRNTKGDESADALAKPDIRTLYILFCLSFVEQDTSAPVKTMFLEQHRDAFFSIFRGLAQDPFVVIRRVLEICWSGIWMDLKLKRTLKIGLFGEITVAHLLKIYERSNSEDNAPDNVPADVAHHFLLAICTRPGVGICFKDRGWYPRKSDNEEPQDEDDGNGRSRSKGGRIHNKILANILKTLKVNEDSRQQELALRMMTACPELVAGYWPAAGLTLEPRLSSKWIANIAFFSSVLALPIPVDSFLSSIGVLYHPTPPPLSTVLENTFPSVGTKTHLSKGLQNPSGLVQHCSALALCKCLTKYSRVLQALRSVSAALEEDEMDGQWAKLQRDLEREIRHRVPEFQVIIAFASKQGAGDADPTKAALLAEAAQRLMWMYYSCLPQLVAESRFDVGKLVQNLSELDRDHVRMEDGDQGSVARLNLVRQLHVLRLLNESDQFQWSGKAASGKTHSHVLLDAYCSSETPALQQTIRNLLINMLSRSVVFESSPDEPALWLSALPLARASEGSPAVVELLDDCIQRCVKTPYKYIEEMQALPFLDLPSPLIMVVLEQLRAKMTGKHPLLQAQLIAVVGFLRRLVLYLSGVQRELGFLLLVVDKIEDIFSDAEPFLRTQFAAMRELLPPRHRSSGTQDPESPFDELFANASVSDIAQRRQTLVDSINPLLPELKQAVYLVGHSLHASESSDLSGALVLLLAATCEKAKAALSASELQDFKEHVFIRTPAVVALCTTDGLSPDVVDAVSALLKETFDSAKQRDRDVVANLASFWLHVLTTSAFSPASAPWIQYIETNDLMSVLRNLSQQPILQTETLDAVITALEVSVRAQAIPDIHKHLDLLTSLRASLPDSSALEDMMAAVIVACTPMGLSGRSLQYLDVPATELLTQARIAWSHRGHLMQISSLELRPFLYQERPWRDSTVSIISALLLRSTNKSVFEAWLPTESASQRSTPHLLRVIHAYLDVLGTESPLDGGAWEPHLSRFISVVIDENLSSDVPAEAESCLRLLLRRIPNISKHLAPTLKTQVKSISKDTPPTVHALRFCVWLTKNARDASAVVALLLDRAMRWCIGYFAEPVSAAYSEPQDVVRELANLVRNTKTVESETAQTLAGVIIQNRLSDIAAVELLSAVLRVSSFKPLIVNRLLQSIIQHPHFFKVCGAAGPARAPLVHALHIIFNLHPANTCQATHIQPLIGIYRGTCSTPDRQLLEIFRLFETHRKVSVASLFAQWSSSEGGATSANALEALQTLDAALVLRTCLHFPKWRTLDTELDFEVSERFQDGSLYDPVFVILLFAQTMAEKVPESAFAWIEMFRTNVVGLLIRTLSCKDSRLREVARLQLAALWAHLEYADMQEQPHVVYVMNVLRNTLPASPSELVGRLPSYTTLVLAHAIRGIFYPSNFTYPLTARFLLQRPAIDTTDVPMLYGMLYNSGDDWKKERGWMIRFISDGMMSTADWRVLKRRHTWELLAGLFQSSEHDLPLRTSILEVLANLTNNAQAATSLILKTSLLHWIEIQLLASTTEGVAWIKILENIMLIVDAEKLENATGGEWRSVICRCLSLVVRGAARSPKLGDIASFAASATLRLSSFSGPTPSSMGDLLAACLQAIKALEIQVDLRLIPSHSEDKTPVPPHRGVDLGALDERPLAVRWGNAVDQLWQSVMRLPEVPDVWDELSYRLLVWRTVVGEDGSTNGEWARKWTLTLCNT
ncbi:hypothetical protein HMN09_01387300 [Mycena chlorophos]|uniref:Nucleolar pre-ribosomal-associated protein 1 C-terminal domain-containing protein n=1 Tax=Mycena chlorophos TaxID=658473 RepID=A0A8H6RYF9_MYCCL|nr:hypothetical protein HMN09_01387300 [Mycena chlorophos]